MGFLFLILMLAGSPNRSVEYVDVKALLAKGLQAHDEKFSVCGEYSTTGKEQVLQQYSGYDNIGYVYIEIDPRLLRSKRNGLTCVTGRFTRKDRMSKKEVMRRFGGITIADSNTTGGYWMSKN